MPNMTVKEYALSRGRTTQGVYQLIRRHEKEMKRFLKKDLGKTVVTEEGQALLDRLSEKPQVVTGAILEAPHLEDELQERIREFREKFQEAQEKALQLTEEKIGLQDTIIQKQEQILQMQDRIQELTEQNAALQVQLMEAKQPKKEPEPDLFDQEDGPADQTPDEGPSDLYDPEDLGPDPEPIRRAAVADPGQPERKKGFFARLFGL